MRREPRIAIIGCGKIADGHIEQIRAIGAGRVVAVCDREPLMAEQLADRMQVPGRYTDVERLLADEKPDVVHIATPPDAHLALGEMAMRAGCHVFMEKPFTPTAADAERLLATARQLNRRISVNYLYNFETPGLRLETLLDEGRLGDVVHLDTDYGYNLAGDYGIAVMSDPNHWVHRLPGKLFQNVLDHVLAKLVRHLSDDTQVQVLAFRRRPACGNVMVDAMPDELRVQMRSGAVTASILVSAHGRPVPHSLRVVGTRDTVDLDYANRTIVHRARQSQPSAVGRLFPAWVQAKAFAGNGWRNLGDFRKARFHYFEGMRVLLRRFYDAIEHGSSDPIPPEHILRVCRLIDQIVAGLREQAGPGAVPLTREARAMTEETR